MVQSNALSVDSHMFSKIRFFTVTLSVLFTFYNMNVARVFQFGRKKYRILANLRSAPLQFVAPLDANSVSCTSGNTDHPSIFRRAVLASVARVPYRTSGTATRASATCRAVPNINTVMLALVFLSSAAALADEGAPAAAPQHASQHGRSTLHITRCLNMQEKIRRAVSSRNPYYAAI